MIIAHFNDPYDQTSIATTLAVNALATQCLLSIRVASTGGQRDVAYALTFLTTIFSPIPLPHTRPPTHLPTRPPTDPPTRALTSPLGHSLFQ